MCALPAPITITLERDGLDQPWGFRLQGGVDCGVPLSVQRVLVGTSCEGNLQRGDVIKKISSTDSRGLSHDQAAHLFATAGNQIAVEIIRSGSAVVAPTANGPPPPAPIVPPNKSSTPVRVQLPTASPSAAAVTPPVSGGVALPGLSAPPAGAASSVNNLPKTTFVLKDSLPQLQGKEESFVDKMENQPQPYRTTPLEVTPPTAPPSIGIGSFMHLKKQAEIISKEPQYVPISSQTNMANELANEAYMKQKVVGTLNEITMNQQQTGQPFTMEQQQQPPPQISQTITSHTSQQQQDQMAKTVVNKQFNSPLPIYSQENAQEAMKQQTGMVNTFQDGQGEPQQNLRKFTIPTKPANQVLLTPKKDFNPQESLTWRAVQESEAPIDQEKLENFTSLKEHDAVYSEVYSHPKVEAGTRPPPRQNANPPARSPVADFLPFDAKRKEELSTGGSQEFLHTPSRSPQPSAVLAALGDEPQRHYDVKDENVPVYETNSIGGRKRIAQSYTFNKLMSDVLGE